MQISKLTEQGADFTQDGKYVHVDIYADGYGQWLLQVIDEFMNYTCPEMKFGTEQKALDYVEEIIVKEGIDEFISLPENVPKEQVNVGRLNAAIFYGNLNDAKKLVKEGVEIDWQDDYGTTPLHNATHNGNVEFVRLLINSGANSSFFDELQRTPLHYACEQENTEMVELMLEHGADINIQNCELIGETPLSNIADTCSYNFFLFMLSKGADIDLTGWVQLSSKDHFNKRTDDDGEYIQKYMSSN